MKNRGLPIVSVAGRVTVFLFIFTLFILALYILGSFQSFVDETLIYLLITVKYSALVFIGFSYAYIVILLVAGRNTGRKIVSRIILSFLGSIPAVAIFVVIQIIISGLEPI